MEKQNSLSKKELDYAKSFHSIRRAGLVTTICSVASFFIAIIGLMMTPVISNEGSGYLEGMLFFAVNAVICTAISTALWSGSIKPKSSLIILIIQLVVLIPSLFLFGSALLPIIYTTIALSRWSNFNHMHKDKKIMKDKLTLMRIVEYGKMGTMKTGFIVLSICMFGLGGFIGTCSTSISVKERIEAEKISLKNTIENSISEERKEAYQMGQKNGYDNGYEDGKTCMLQAAQEIIRFGNPITDVYSCKKL